MTDGQNNLYYITGESASALSSSPVLEVFRKKDLEMLYVCDPDDEYAVQQIQEFDGMQLKSGDGEYTALPPILVRAIPPGTPSCNIVFFSKSMSLYANRPLPRASRRVRFSVSPVNPHRTTRPDDHS